MDASMYLSMVTKHEGEREKNEGAFRVRTYVYWPYVEEDDDPMPKDEFFDYFDSARNNYMIQTMKQIMEMGATPLEYVELGTYNEFTGFYETMFASHQLHTFVSYGLNPEN